MFSKKSQGLPLRTLVVIIIVLIVLALVLLFFTKSSSTLFDAFSEKISAILDLL